MDVLKTFDRGLAEQVIEVPKVTLQDVVPQRAVLCRNSWWTCPCQSRSEDRRFAAVLGLVGTRPCCATTGCMVQTVQKLWKYHKCSTLTGWSMFLLLQFIDKVGRPCDLAVTELMGFCRIFHHFSRSSGLSRSRAPVS